MYVYCRRSKFLSILNLSSHFSYKNGSVTRERIRNEVAEGNWDLFNQLLDSTPRGNFGNIGKHMRDNRMNIIFYINVIFHSSEIRGLHSTKCSSETLQNLLYFMYKKTHVVFFCFLFLFHFVQQGKNIKLHEMKNKKNYMGFLIHKI